MRTVLDASCAVAMVLDEAEVLSTTRRAFAQVLSRGVIVPAVFWYEVRHALLRAHRRGGLTKPGLVRARQQVADLTLEADGSHEETRAFDLAERHGLSFYDATYLETALRRTAALATVDRRLAAAAVAENVVSLA